MFINWYDTRNQHKEVDSFFYNLTDLIHELGDLQLDDVEYVMSKYGIKIYSTEYENYNPRVKFDDTEKV